MKINNFYRKMSYVIINYLIKDVKNIKFRVLACIKIITDNLCPLFGLGTLCWNTS